MSDKRNPLGDFVFALLYMTDERTKAEPCSELIDSWYDEAQRLFKVAVTEAVQHEMAALEVIVRPKV